MTTEKSNQGMVSVQDSSSNTKKVMKVCPRCKKKKNLIHPAISRRDNKTEICSYCGTAEALFDFAKFRAGLKKSEKQFSEKDIDTVRSWLEEAEE